jgi:predicted CXXCH cytochrome family protein
MVTGLFQITIPSVSRVIDPQMSRKHPIYVASCIIGMLLISQSALAGIENTHHDMGIYSEGSEEELCLYCHVPYGERSDEGLFSRVTPNIKDLGAVAAFCYYSCHDGTVVPTALVEGPDGTLGLEVLVNSHGFEVDRLESVSSGMEDASNIYSSGVFDGRIGDTGMLDCISCHNPHSNENPPFLQQPLERLCISCHSGLDRTGFGRWTSPDDDGPQDLAHPIGVAMGTFENAAPYKTQNGMSFHEPNEVFSVAMPDALQLQLIDVHWELGGHLFGEEREVDCSTCHSAHMPVANLLVAAATRNPEKAVCSGCHGEHENSPNPGATPFYHPVYEESLPPHVHDHADHGDIDPNIPSVGPIELFISIPEEFSVTKKETLLCTTCHITHGGVEGAKCLRSGPKEWLGGVICNECHGTGSYIVGANWHHPVSPEDFAQTGFPRSLPWSEGPGLPGDLSDGLQCTDCHTEWAKNAHNW